MGTVSGIIKEITVNHATLGSHVFFPKASEDSTIDPGGYRSADDAGMIDGGLNMIDQMNPVRWSVECPVAWDQVNRKDLDFAVKLASSPVEGEYTFTHISGTIYGGKGKPVGDLQGNGNTGVFTLKVSGGGVLKTI